MKDALFSWLRTLLEAAVPFSCHLCRRATPWGSVLCSACAGKLTDEMRPPFRISGLLCRCPAWTLGAYEGTLAAAIKTGKYRPSPKLVRRLAELAGEVCRKAWPGPLPEVVIPVPLHPTRLGGRGFNQAEILARELARRLSAHCSPALARLRQTRPQAECDEVERASNLRGAFALAAGLRPEAFRGRRLCLVDDVATTGATLEECRQVLAPLTPSSLVVLTLVHSPRRLPPSRTP